MNNMFLEGPIQTGKSTLIRKVLAERFGPALDEVGGFTCQRITFPALHGEVTTAQTPAVHGDSCIRPDLRIGFRLMPAQAPIAAHTCAIASDRDIQSTGNLFKFIGSGSPYVNLNVFETTGVRLLSDALSRAKSETAGQNKISIVLLDEIGGHEMICPKFRETLYEILESDVPCIGVIKLEESARQMVSRMNGPEADAIIGHNIQLHRKIMDADSRFSEILYFERGDEYVADRLREFAATCPPV